MGQSLNGLVILGQRDEWSGYTGTKRINVLVFLTVVINNCVQFGY